MTFEDFLDEYYPSSERPDDPNYYFIVGLKAAWNAAINSVIYELGDQAYKDNYAYKSGDPEYAEDVAKNLLTA